VSRNLWDPASGLFGMFDIWSFRGIESLVSSGLGGGSLIYANVTIQPPDSVLASWPITWDTPTPPGPVPEPQNHNQWYDLARNSIGLGVLAAWDTFEASQTPSKPVGTGLSNIVTRSARLEPHWNTSDPDPVVPGRKLKKLDPAHSVSGTDTTNSLWIDRARVFQATSSQVLG